MKILKRILAFFTKKTKPFIDEGTEAEESFPEIDKRLQKLELSKEDRKNCEFRIREGKLPKNIRIDR